MTNNSPNKHKYWMKRGVLSAAFAMLPLVLIGLTNTAYAQDISSLPVIKTYNASSPAEIPNSQFNQPKVETFTLAQRAEVFFNYDVSFPNATSAHCSSIRLHVRVNDNLLYTSPFMGWYAAPHLGVPAGDGPLTTGYVSLGVFPAGTHTIATQQEGRVGGCNKGRLSGGSGPITLKARFEPATVPPKETPKPQCSDGIDNDGDGKIDNQDPGCYTNGIYDPNDDDERDVAVKKPQCSDGIDNDGDGKIDNQDPGCYTNGIYDPNDDSEIDPAVKQAQKPAPVPVTAKTGTGIGFLAVAMLLGGTAIIPAIRRLG